jgi:lysophospholipase L1-like esterase
VSTAFALVVCEGVVHLVDPAGISYYKWSKAYNHDRVEDDDLVWRHRPDFRGTYDGIEYSFNEIGLRDSAIEEKAKDELRILVLGDSITMGWGVAEEDTYCRQLERSLKKRLGRRVRVINSGVGGYNTVQELEFFRRHAKDLKPDVVLLLYVRNDVDAEGWKASMAAVASIADECGDTPFVTFLWRYGPCPVTDALRQDLSRVAGDREFVLADAAPWFEGHDARDLRLSIVDSHPKPEGHAILAEGIERVLADAALLNGLSWQVKR